jgi:hypothetical protein
LEEQARLSIKPGKNAPPRRLHKNVSLPWLGPLRFSTVSASVLAAAPGLLASEAPFVVGAGVNLRFECGKTFEIARPLLLDFVRLEPRAVSGFTLNQQLPYPTADVLVSGDDSLVPSDEALLNYVSFCRTTNDALEAGEAERDPSDDFVLAQGFFLVVAGILERDQNRPGLGKEASAAWHARLCGGGVGGAATSRFLSKSRVTSSCRLSEAFSWLVEECGDKAVAAACEKWGPENW